MPGRNFHLPGALSGPGAIGRLLRLAMGVGLLYWVTSIATTVGSEVDSTVSALIIAGVSFWLINEIVNVGLGRDWGQRPRIASLAGASLLFVIGWVGTGDVESQLLLWGLLLYGLVSMGWLGASFILAALLAVPG